MELPELPPAGWGFTKQPNNLTRILEGKSAYPNGFYDADAMRAYALEAIAAERERCAQLCETLNHGAFGNSSYLSGIQDGSVGCAAAIRAQGSKA